MGIIGGVLIFLAVLTIPVGIIGLISPKTVSPKDKPPLPRLQLLWSFLLVFLVFAIVGGVMLGSSESPKVAKSDSQTAISETGLKPSSATDAAQSYVPPPPAHNYAMRDGDLYGYQPAISDSERSQGVATKALIMVRYRGQKNGVYTVEMPDDSGAVYRMECESPCKYVKTKVIAGGEVLRSETVPNAPDSLMAAVFDDVLSGQLQSASAPSRVGGGRSKGESRGE